MVKVIAFLFALTMAIQGAAFALPNENANAAAFNQGTERANEVANEHAL